MRGVSGKGGRKRGRMEELGGREELWRNGAEEEGEERKGHGGRVVVVYRAQIGVLELVH